MNDNESIVELFRVMSTTKDKGVRAQIKKKIDSYNVDKTEYIMKLIAEIQVKIEDMSSRISSISQQINS